MNKSIKNLFIIGFIYLLLSFGVFLYLEKLNHLVFGWNIFLAMIPLGLTLFLIKNNLNRYFLAILIILYILFLPNSFYLITDFIHLQESHFFTDMSTYNFDIKIWISLLHIALGFLLGFIFGNLSLYMIHEKVKNRIGRHSWYLIIAILFLSSVGIYIGRFLRFNSWDIVRPITLIQKFISQINPFMLNYTLIMTLILILSYVSFYHLFNYFRNFNCRK